MDIEDIESSLDALRKLYRLLRKDGDTAPDFTSTSLDDKSRLLLKNLLDMETKKVLKAHSEVSGTKYSAQPLQPCDEWKQQPYALQNQSDALPMIQNSGKDLDKFDYKYAKITNQETPPTNPMIGYGSRNKRCRICKGRIVEQTTMCEPKAGYQIISLHQLNNCVGNFPESSRTLENKKQKGLDGLDIAENGSMQFSLCRPEKSTTEATEQCQVVNSLPEEASDVIKQIELFIQNLKISSGSSDSGLCTRISCPMDKVAQNELSNRISDCVPKSGSAKSPVFTETEWGQTGYSDSESADEEHGDSSPQRPLSTKTISQEMLRMKLQNENSVQPYKCLPPRNSMMNDQGEDTSYFGHNVKSIIAKIESLNQARQNDLRPDSYMITKRVPDLNTPVQNDVIPKEMYNFKDLSSNGYMNSVMVPASVTWLPNQIDKENLNDISRTPGACQTSQPSSIPVDYLSSGTNIQTDDSCSKVNQNQSWKARRKKNSPFQEFEGQAQSSKWLNDQEQVRSPKRKCRRNNPPRKISRRKLEYEKTNMNSSSSSWRSQQASTSSSESEEIYFPRWKRGQKYASPSPSSSSGVYSRRPRHQWHEYDNTSSSVDEYTSTISDRDYNELASTSCNESGEFSLPTSARTDQFSSSVSDDESKDYSWQPRFQHHRQPRYSRRNWTPEDTGSTRFCRRPKLANPKKKQVGAWKKLKDKLSIIFHHHHHHHHHHHLDSDEDGRDASNRVASISSEKNLQKCTNKSPPAMRFETYGERAVQKFGKPFGNAVQYHRKQRHHFNKLVGGLFRHILHSKKSGISAKKVKHLGIGQQHEGKKVSRKQQWCRQLLQRQRKFKKLGLGHK